MMDVLLAQNRVTPEMISRVAEKVAAFHAKAKNSPDISKYGSVETVTFNTEENFNQTAKYIGPVFPQSQFDRIAVYTRNFIKKNAKLFQLRVEKGKIKDCHGDLHSQHICFTDNGIAIYDCIEFNDRFRYVDVAAEVSFLAMDLDRWGHPDLSRQFVNAYVSKSRDKEILRMLHFYKCYFAYVRAKVSCFKSEAPLVSPEDKNKAVEDARRYFNLAESYIE
jgi:aminoglycoside phosphotransferase family enzyme